MISILPSAAWREYRGQPSKHGANKTTHLATIEGPDGKLHRCYVKMVPGRWPTVLTESIAWLIADALDLPRPGFAAIVAVPVDRLRQCMALDQHWLGYNEWPGFCAEAVDGKAPVQTWRWLDWLTAKGVFKKEEVRRISAFDEWVENRDRHRGNLIRRSDGTCVAIDNEFALWSPVWTAIMGPGFNVVPQSLLTQAQASMKPAAMSRFKVEVARAGDRHAAAYVMTEQAVIDTIKALVADPAASAQLVGFVTSFLRARSDPTWLRGQLGVIA